MSNEAITIAAPGEPWPLTLQEFDTKLRIRWPDARVVVKRSHRSNQEYLNFAIGEGSDTRTGSYTPYTQLDLWDDTPEFWANTIAWFLSLLPFDSEVACLLEAVPELTPIPRDSSSDQIAAILNELNSR